VEKRLRKRFAFIVGGVAAIAAAAAVIRHVARGPSDGLHVALSPSDISEQLRKERSQHHESIREHEREPLDSAWAAATTASLRDDLRAWSRGGAFDVVSVDCRSATCVGAITFPSYAAARERWARVVSAPTHAGCGSEATLDEPSGRDERFAIQILYRCPRATTASKL
jgi:hypothetical protein